MLQALSRGSQTQPTTVLHINSPCHWASAGQKYRVSGEEECSFSSLEGDARTMEASLTKRVRWNAALHPDLQNWWRCGGSHRALRAMHSRIRRRDHSSGTRLCQGWDCHQRYRGPCVTTWSCIAHATVPTRGSSRRSSASPEPRAQRRPAAQWRLMLFVVTGGCKDKGEGEGKGLRQW